MYKNKIYFNTEENYGEGCENGSTNSEKVEFHNHGSGRIQ